MNKQELIEEIEKIRNNIEWIEPKEAIAFRRCLNIIEQLDESSREECEVEQVSENEIECLSCNHIFTNINLTFDEEYEFPDDGYEFYKANYCPNCGSKIKRENSDDN